MKTELNSQAATTQSERFEPSASQTRAREIMGRNMFGIEEAIKHFSTSPTDQQLAPLSEIPYCEDVLQSCKDTHVLVAVFLLSILEIRERVQDERLFYNQNWYDKQAFANEKDEVRWQLVCKTPVDSSTHKTWPEQQALLSKDEEVPTAQVMVYTIIGHFLATGERLLERVYVRTSSVGSNGDRVCVGYFDSGGLGVGRCWDDHRDGNFGVAASRKLS